MAQVDQEADNTIPQPKVRKNNTTKLLRTGGKHQYSFRILSFQHRALELEYLWSEKESRISRVIMYPVHPLIDFAVYIFLVLLFKKISAIVLQIYL